MSCASPSLVAAGLIYHNRGQVDLAVSTYTEALSSWVKALPRGHSVQNVLMVICGAIGGALESALKDEAALAVYTLGVVAGKQLPEPSLELGYCLGCMGSALFHMGSYDTALPQLQACFDLRSTLDAAEESVVTVEELAVAENNIGACCVAMENNVTGMKFYKSAYDRLREKYQPHHTFVMSVQQNIQRARLNLCNHDVDMSLMPRPIFRPKKEKKAKGGKKKKKK